MKTLKRLLILLLVLFLLLGVAHLTRAQDITRTTIGYDVDYPFVYVRKDTIHGLTYLYNHYPHKMYFSANGGKATLLPRNQVMTVWSKHFVLTVSRKKYRREYRI